MKSKTNLFLTLFVVCLGGFIGFDPMTPTQSVTANDKPMIRWVDVPKVKSNIVNLNIDLQNDEVKIDGNIDKASVNIVKETEAPKTIVRTKVVEKEVFVPVNNPLSTKLLDKFVPLKMVKLSTEDKRGPQLER